MKTSYSAAQQSGLNRSQVESLAENIALQLGVSPGEDLAGAIAKAGGRVRYCEFRDLQESDSGSLQVHGENNFEIFISYNTSPLRDRFTVAHELGHYVLHFLYPRQHSAIKPETLQATRYGSDRAEWEANWFAAAFLMPGEAFRASFERWNGNTALIAQQFGVSESAAKVRAKTLGLA